MKRTGFFMVLLGVLTLAAVVWAVTQRGAPLPAASAPPEGSGAASHVADTILDAAARYSASGALDRAEAVLRAGVAEHPDDAPLRRALAGVLLQQNKKPGALAQYERLVEDGSASDRDAFMAGSLAAVLGDQTKAAAYHERAQALDPTNPDYPVHLARAQIASGRLDDAKASLVRAAVLDEGRGMVWGMLAELALRENKLDMASQHIAKARRLEPEVAAWRVLEARILKRRGEPERALLLLSGLGEADRWRPPVVREMAACEGMLHRPAEALALYEQAIRKQPDNPELYYEGAIWAERIGDPGRARELARRARMLGEERADAIIERLDSSPGDATPDPPDPPDPPDIPPP